MWQHKIQFTDELVTVENYIQNSNSNQVMLSKSKIYVKGMFYNDL